MGGGLALASYCALRIAAGGAVFGVPAARLGLAYGVQAQVRLSDLIGTSAAVEMLMTARRLDTAEALRLGLIHHAVPANDFAAFADDYAAQVLANAPLTLKTVKAVRISQADGTLAARADDLLAMVEMCFASTDYAEGRAAFDARRPPRFTGA